MFDTHCHLNFKTFANNVGEVIGRAKKAGVNYFVVPGTDIDTSKRAVEIAERFENVYAAVGIHPHNAYVIFKKAQHHVSHSRLRQDFGGQASGSPSPELLGADIPSRSNNLLHEIEKLLSHKKVLAIGEVGIDKHYYQKTKYENYQVNEIFLELQKEFLKAQIKLAIKYDKSLILHNREAAGDLIEVLNEKWDKKLAGRTVFHCCDSDWRLLDFAIKHNVYIGVDGDVTYDKRKPFDFAQGKQEFVKKIPLKLLVLETDSPFLIPQLSGSRSWTRYNEPKNIIVIAEFVANFLKKDLTTIKKITTQNAKKLFF